MPDFSAALRAACPTVDAQFLQSYAAAFIKTAATENDPPAPEAAAHLLHFATRRLYGQAQVTVGAAPDRLLSAVCVLNDDMPFLVDSLVRALNARGLSVGRLFHPVLPVGRDAGGVLSGNAGPAESWIYLELDRRVSPAEATALEHELTELFRDVSDTVGDREAMFAAAEASVSALEARPDAAEEAAFLRFLIDHNFVFMGVLDVGAEAAAPCGLYKRRGFQVFREEEAGEPAALLSAQAYAGVFKADRRASVHRRAPFDVVAVARFDAAGRRLGERRFVGLLTSSAYAAAVEDLPIARRKAQSVFERAAFAPGGHDAKNLRHVLDVFPRDELLQIDEDTLFEHAGGMARFETRPQVRVFVRTDSRGRSASVIVLLPRDVLGAELRDKIAELLSVTCGAAVAEVGSQVGETGSLTVRYSLSLDDPGRGVPDAAALEERVRALAVSPDLRLRRALAEPEAADIAGCYAAYRQAFPAAYFDLHADHLIDDLRAAEALSAEHTALLRVRPGTDGRLTLRLFRLNAPMPLSECLPMFENFGMRVISEYPYRITAQHRTVYLQVLETVPPVGAADPQVYTAITEAAFDRVLRGEAENDGLNALCVLAGLPDRDVSVLRAAVRYLRQARATFDRDTMESALRRAPAAASALCAGFRAAFDPRVDEAGRPRTVAEAAALFEAALARVTSAEDDRVLRALQTFFGAVLRTNLFLHKSYLSFKLDPAKLSFLPQPVPYREIWVCSPRVEGVHLRFAPVARGGLRWSDRRDDFRTEVLGLVKAQRVKNAVIVPSGAKGGFYPKQLSELTGEARQREAVECYKTFLRGLLDLTDNIDGDKVLPPENVVRLDADDPYLVVAADKGTATFSDIANALAAEYGFWLGDAFASGGSVGYDHKKMGITARGAWEAVKRHFRETGHDIQREPFDVIGVGDMSGDVFGNGMLLSPHIRLRAAFDHRDIFFDPAPDPAVSFAERKRLFELPRSSWQDYNAALISPGGGVFSRSLKQIPLNDALRALTGLTGESATPTDVMRALLSAETDLLWFGGIGTYIKAAAESHTEAGDKANDAVRVDAEELRAKVIGEGANLGLTQRGRIAFARKGGRINTDAVDNSAGVDCSDHEVNIKIALRYVQGTGRLTEEARNVLLAEMTDEVGELVLRTNRDQTLALSLEEAEAAAGLERHRLFMQRIEKDGMLQRAVEFLPSERECDVLRASGQGLSRPELAVLMAYAKIDAADRLLQSGIGDRPALAGYLTEYMPRPLTAAFPEALKAHRLRQEIITTVLANRLVHETGPAFLQTVLEGGGTVRRAGEAFAAVRALFRKLIPEEVLYDHTAFVDAAAHTRFFLRYRAAMRREVRRLIVRNDPIEPIGDEVAAAVRALPDLLQGAFGEALNAAAAETTGDCCNTDAARALAVFALPITPLGLGVSLWPAATQLLAEAGIDRALLRLADADTTGDPFERAALLRALADTEKALAAAALRCAGTDRVRDAFRSHRFADFLRFGERLSSVRVLGSAHVQLLNNSLDALLA